MNYRETIRLPETGFAMKGNLPAREPEILARWESDGIEDMIRKARKGAPVFILHDGPPYANGSVHLGTALNKILKDFVVKSHTMLGFDSPFVPGWDCHGMPIEHRVLSGEDDGGKSLSRLEIRQRCREYANRFVDVQRGEFRRLGVFGAWDRPYLTMSREYESGILRAFGELVRKGYVYQGLRPISWCTTCSTALADAEIEYGPHDSPSIWVGFAQSEPGAWLERGVPEGVEVAIWTTTPWTLPANLAVALNPGEQYLVVESSGRRYLVAERRASSFVESACAGRGSIVEGTSVRGDSLEGLGLAHPLFTDRTSRVILAEHVTMDDGTGCVHTAPGHGAEDFAAGQRYGLETFSPVDARGVFTDEAGRFSGLSVGRANPVIVEELRTSGRLIADSRMEHSYPHCWRCKQPLIFRATRQFFLDLSHDRLKERVLESVDKISWHPSWGYDRMKNMMAARPDWCLSRQRSWGVALPAFICRGCGSAVLDPDVIAAAAELVAREGSDAWFSTSPGEIFAAAGRAPSCGECGGTVLDRVDDILDVWFDSSLSHYCVLDGGFGLERPASVYLEATDQHRGWFGVSLITSTGLDLGIPARNIVTHGLVLDKQGKKMSKSLGNVVSPLEIVETMGADILRLWFAGVDYTADFRADKAMLDDAREAYRKLRNTLRFMLGNLDGGPRTFDRCVPGGLDRYVWLRFRQVLSKCIEEYRAFQFHRVYRELRNLATTELSGLFLDIRKDRLYCDAPDDPRTAATRGLLGWMTVELIKLLAPLMPFTAEEAWGELPVDLRSCSSVHLALLNADPLTGGEEQELAAWDELLEVRRVVLKSLEDARAAGRIGSGLDSDVELAVPSRHLDSACGEDWADFLIVSGVRTRPSEEISVEVVPSTSPKCARCWKLKPEIGSGRFPDVCGRCGSVLERAGYDGQ
jgi:isoleucyl-tRNA synthetase